VSCGLGLILCRCSCAASKGSDTGDWRRSSRAAIYVTESRCANLLVRAQGVLLTFWLLLEANTFFYFNASSNSKVSDLLASSHWFFLLGSTWTTLSIAVRHRGSVRDLSDGLSLCNIGLLIEHLVLSSPCKTGTVAVRLQGQFRTRAGRAPRVQFSKPSSITWPTSIRLLD